MGAAHTTAAADAHTSVNATTSCHVGISVTPQRIATVTIEVVGKRVKATAGKPFGDSSTRLTKNSGKNKEHIKDG